MNVSWETISVIKFAITLLAPMCVAVIVAIIWIQIGNLAMVYCDYLRLIPSINHYSSL